MRRVHGRRLLRLVRHGRATGLAGAGGRTGGANVLASALGRRNSQRQHVVSVTRHEHGPAGLHIDRRFWTLGRLGGVCREPREPGGGLVEVPPVPYRDPASVVMVDAEVPERKRYCSSCGHPVGRGRDGQPGRTEGFCTHAGMPYSFTPKLLAP